MDHPLCTLCLADCLILYMDNNDPTTMKTTDKEEYIMQEFSRKLEKHKHSSDASEQETKTDISQIKIMAPKTTNDRKKSSWSFERLNQLAKPKKDYYEYAKENIVTIRHGVRPVNAKRINYLATPRKREIQHVVKFKRKVPLSVLLPRIERMLTPLKRSDYSEHIRTAEEIYSVKKAALNYVATERLKQLATPRTLCSEE